jgi:hypothetical protein
VKEDKRTAQRQDSKNAKREEQRIQKEKKANKIEPTAIQSEEIHLLSWYNIWKRIIDHID